MTEKRKVTMHTRSTYGTRTVHLPVRTRDLQLSYSYAVSCDTVKLSSNSRPYGTDTVISTTSDSNADTDIVTNTDPCTGTSLVPTLVH